MDLLRALDEEPTWLRRRGKFEQQGIERFQGFNTPLVFVFPVCFRTSPTLSSCWCNGPRSWLNAMDGTLLKGGCGCWEQSLLPGNQALKVTFPWLLFVHSFNTQYSLRACYILGMVLRTWDGGGENEDINRTRPLSPRSSLSSGHLGKYPSLPWWWMGLWLRSEWSSRGLRGGCNQLPVGF